MSLFPSLERCVLQESRPPTGVCSGVASLIRCVFLCLQEDGKKKKKSKKKADDSD